MRATFFSLPKNALAFFAAPMAPVAVCDWVAVAADAGCDWWEAVLGTKFARVGCGLCLDFAPPRGLGLVAFFFPRLRCGEGWVDGGDGGGKRWVLPEVLLLVVDEMCALLR